MIVPLSRGAPAWEVLATKLAYPLFHAFIAKVLGLTEAKAAASLATIRAVFAECDARLADGRTFLTGDRVTLQAAMPRGLALLSLSRWVFLCRAERSHRALPTAPARATRSS